MGLLDSGSGGKKFDIISYIGADNSQFKQVVNESDKQAGQLGASLDKIMNRALVAGTAAFTAITYAAMKFETQMALVDTLLAGADRTVETLSKDTLKYMTSSASSMQITTKALYDTISASIPASQALEVVGLSAKAAAAGFTSVEIANKAGIANMNAFGLAVEDLTKIYDLQFSAVKYGVFTYEELASSIGMVLPAAKTLNVSMEDMYGSLAFLTKAGQSAHFATTNLSRAFQDLVQKQDKLAKFDITIWDKTTGKFLGMENVIGQIAKVMEGMTDQQRAATLEVMNFDVRAGRAINSMVNNYEGFVKTLGQVKNSTGAMNEGYAAVSETFERQGKILKNIVQVAYIEMGQKVTPILNDILMNINKHPEAVMAMVKAFTELVITLGAVAGAYKVISIAQKLMKIDPVILGLTALAAAIIALKNYTDAYRRSIINNIEATSDDIKEVSQLKKEYDALGTEMTLGSKEATRYSEVSSQLSEKLKEAGLSTDSLKKSTAELTKEYKAARIAELEKQIGDLTIAIDKQAEYTTKWYNIYTWGNKGVLNDYQNRLASVKNEITELTTSQGFLNQAGIQTEKQMRALLASYEAELGGLEKTSYEYTKLAEKIKALKIELGDIVEPTDKLKTNIEKLKDAGVLFEGEITKQIAELEKLKIKYSDNVSVVYQLELKIKDLEDQLVKITPPIYKVDTSFVGLKDTIKDLNLQQAIAKGLFIDTKPEVKDLADDVDKSKKEWAGYVSVLNDVIGGMQGVSDQGKALMTFLTTAAGSGFDPLATAIAGVNLVLSLFNDEGDKVEKIVITIEDMIIRMGEFGKEIQKIRDAFAEIGSEISSPIVDKMQAEIDRLIQTRADIEEVLDIKALEPKIRAYYEAQLAAVNLLIDGAVAAMQKFTAVFSRMTGIEKIADDIGYLVEMGLKQWNYFLGNVDMSGWAILMEEQMTKAFIAMSGNIDRTSPAFLALKKSVTESMVAMRLMGFDINKYIPTLLNLGFTQEEINEIFGLTYEILEKNVEVWVRNTDAMNAYSDSTNDAIDANNRLNDSFENLPKKYLGMEDINLDSLKDQWNVFSDIMKEGHDAIADLLYFKIDLDTSLVDDAILRTMWQQSQWYKMLDPTSPMAIAVKKGIIDLATDYLRLGEAIPLWLVTALTAILGEDFVRAITKADIAVVRFTDDMGKAAQYAGRMNDSFEDIGKTVKDFDNLDMTINIDDWDKFTSQLEAGRQEVDDLLFFKVDLDTTFADENLLLLIMQLTRYADTLVPGSPAFEEAKAGIYQLAMDYISLGLAIPDKILAYFTEILGEDFVASLYKADAALNKFVGDMNKAADANGRMNDSFDDLLKKADGLTDLNINIAIENWETFTSQLDAANAAIEELLFFEIDLDTTQADENILRTIWYLTQYYDKLKAGSPAAEAAKKYIIELILNYMKLGKAIPIFLLEYFIEILGEDFVDAIDDADDKLKEFIDTWEEAADRIGGTNDKFEDVEFKLFPEDIEEGILKLRELADQVLSLAEYYGNTNFDGLTDSLIDQINAMQQLLYKLDPTSQAYKDLQYEIYYANAVLWVLQGRIGSVEEFFEKLGIEMRDIERTFFDLSKGVIDFSYHWDLLTGKKVYQWDQFKTDMEEAMDLLAKFKFFKIDLETTDADEAIGQLILRMQAYLETLDPDSKAYKKFKRELDRLIKQFLAAGGIIPFELLDEFDDIDIDIEVDLADAIMELKDVLELLAKIIALAAGFEFDFDTDDAERKAKDLLKKLDITPQEEVFWIGHQGGIVRAHSGYVVAGKDEVPALLQPGEVVLPLSITKNRTADEWNDIISGETGAASADRLNNQIENLNRSMLNLFDMIGQQRPSDVKVVVNNPGLNTTLDLLQDYGEQWLRARERNRINVGIFR